MLLAAAIGEAARDQEMAHLVSLSDLGTKTVPSPFFRPPFRAHRARSNGTKTSEGTDLGDGGHFCSPPCRGAGNVRAGTEPGARFGRADSAGAPTGWAIPPDPQQARGGKIPVQGGP